MSSLQKFHRRTQPFAVNTLHTGTVSISGTASVGSVLTATNNIADANGLGTFSYQWKRSGAAISGATSSTYTLAAADIGNTITITITYTDGKGFTETETSPATVSIPNPPPTLGSGDNSKGYYIGLAGDGTSFMYVAPISTEIAGKTWGSSGTTRGTVSNTNGVSNTNTLYGFGSSTVSGHPAAYYAKTLATGGYNTWYLPAINELATCYTNRSYVASPAPYGSGSTDSYYWSSTETDATTGKYHNFQNFKSPGSAIKTNTLFKVRAVRRA
jgi:hypothetical protein